MALCKLTYKKNLLLMIQWPLEFEMSTALSHPLRHFSLISSIAILVFACVLDNL